MKENKAKGTINTTEEYIEYTTKQNIIYSIKNVWKYDKSPLRDFVVFTFLMGITLLLTTIFPKFILDELLGLKREKELIILITIFFTSLAVSYYFYEYIKEVYLIKVIAIRLKIVNEYYLKCLNTNFKNTEDPNFLDKKDTVAKILMSDSIGIEGMLKTLFEMGGQIAGFIVCISIVSTLSVWIVVYLLINVGIIYLFMTRVKKFEYSNIKKLSSARRRANYACDTLSDFSYGKEIRLFNLSSNLINFFKVNKKKEFEIETTIKNKYLKVNILDILLVLIRDGVVYGYLIYLVIGNKITIGDFTMYFSAMISISTWMQLIIQSIVDIRAQKLYINDIRNFIDYKEVEDLGRKNIPDCDFDIEFKNVSFKYRETENYILKNVSLKISKNEHLAIIGSNGAGKSTFVKLLCKMYEVEEGEILIDGINIKEYSTKEIHKIFSAVFQEVNILAFSLAENIAIKDINYEKLDIALEKVGLNQKVDALEKGVHTNLLKILDEEGIELSGGEKQSVAIARAIYKDGKAFILDEPTSALDALKEYELYKRFDEIVKGRMAIYISHRLSSTHFCDKIAMFEHGELIEYGTHKELIEKNGKYKAMYDIQAQYYVKKQEGNNDVFI